MNAEQLAWCTFGEAVLRRSGQHGYYAYHTPTGSLRWLREASSAGWRNGREVEAREPDAMRAVLETAFRTPRWSASPDTLCSVGAHSVRVGLLAAAVTASDSWVAAANAGGGHDLHELLPGVGDTPGPAGRWLREVSSAFAALQATARRRIAALFALRPVGPELVRVVHWADRAAEAVERAVYFGDAPPWLGEHRRLAELLLVEQVTCDEIAEHDRLATPDYLQYLVANEYTPMHSRPEFELGVRVAQHTRRLAGASPVL